MPAAAADAMPVDGRSSPLAADAAAEAAPARSVVLVYKNHLDVGFTEMAAKVTHDQIRWLLPSAAAMARQLRAEHGKRMFVWTVPAWIAAEALAILDGSELASVERALAEGDIAWHALPFTTHTELMDEALCQSATAMSRGLDRRFGTVTRTAKLTDVPGHSRGLVDVLARCGIDLLHIGVNGMSPLPEVPRAFRWRGAGGNELVTLYEPGYANRARLPGDDQVLWWCFQGDNMELPSTPDIAAYHAAAALAHPAARVEAGRMDDWAAGIRERAASLPVITGEIGDSWIHGSGTDPWKTVRFRELMRLRTRWLAEGALERDGAVDAALTRNLLLVAEHTWGLSFSAHTHHERQHWDNDAFARIRHRGVWRAMEASWQEQRDYLELAVESLPPPQRQQAERALAAHAVPAVTTDADGWTELDPAAPIAAQGWSIGFDRAHGAIASLVDAGGRERVAAGGHLARARYQTFGHDDCRRFAEQYCTSRGDWLLEEFAKLGLRGSKAVSAWWDPTLVSLARRDRGPRTELRAQLAFPEAAVRDAGAPREAELLVSLERGRRVALALTWRGKHATRLPEAMWWSFQPLVADPSRWRLGKLGQLVDPRDVVAKGGRPLHGVDHGALHDDGRERLALLTPDAHLIAPGRPQLYEFTDELPDLAGGLHLNLLNNCWGTNFPMWFGDDMRFRAMLVWDARSGETTFPSFED